VEEGLAEVRELEQEQDTYPEVSGFHLFIYITPKNVFK